MRKLYTTFIVSVALFLFNNTTVKAQYGSDLGPRAVSSLAWGQIVSQFNDNESASTIGLTTDGRVYTWGGNVLFTIKNTISSNTSAPVMQMVPYYVPFPAGEVVKKVQMLSTNVGGSGYYIPTYFALSNSGNLYGWGINTGAVGTAWVVKSTYAAPADWRDTTNTIRRPIPLTILGENSFVDMAASTRQGYWVAVGASGKAYHNGYNGPNNFETTYMALPNPAGVNASTFKYTNVWVADYTDNPPVIYLKGNDGNIYFTGSQVSAFASGVPSIFNLDGSTLTTAQSQGNVRSITPILVPFPAGEDIVDMRVTAIRYPKSSIFALSAGGKAYVAGHWRSVPSFPDVNNTYTVTPLKAAPSSIDLDKIYQGGTGDTTYVVKKFTEIAMPPGATKILDITNHQYSSTNPISVIIGDNNKAYWSGAVLNSNQFHTFVGNYLMYSPDPSAALLLCNRIHQLVGNAHYAWEKEAINFEGAAKFFRIVASGINAAMFIVSKTGRGYYVGNYNVNAGVGKAGANNTGAGVNFFPTPIANEQLLDCQPSPGTGGPLTAGPVAPTNTAVGSIDCSKTQLSPAPTVGTATQLDLIVSINLTTAGTFTPITVSGSGMTVANDINSVTTATTGIQTFHIPMKYDGTALGTLNFTIGSSGGCTADLGTITKKKVINEIWSLDNCTVQTVAPDLK